jgi:hypothetical protein
MAVKLIFAEPLQLGGIVLVRRKQRRKSLLGTYVFVCGQPVSYKPDLVCILPTSIQHRTHVAIGVREDNTLVLVYRETGSKETEWHSVADQDPKGPFMSPGPQ